MILALYCPRHLDSNDSVFVPLVGFRIMIGNSLSQLTLWCMAKADFQLFNCSLSWWPSNNQIKKVLDLYKRNVSSNFKGWPSSDEILLQKLKLEMKNCSCLKIQQQGRPKYSESVALGLAARLRWRERHWAIGASWQFALRSPVPSLVWYSCCSVFAFVYVSPLRNSELLS